MTNITKDFLHEEYVVKGKTMSKIAQEIGTAETWIHTLIHRYGLPVKSRSERLKGRTFSIEHRIKLSQSRENRARGSKNGNWKGGVSTDHNAIRRRGEYIVFRRTVLRIKGEKCNVCGKNLLDSCPTCFHKPDRHVHHIIPFSKDSSKRFSVDNAIVLCESCHFSQHKT